MRWLAIWGLLMATVFEVLLDTGRLLEELREGAATADGTATTLIDTTLSASEGHANDEWNGGTLFWKDSSIDALTTQVLGEVLDVMAAETSLSATLAHGSIKPGTVRFYPPGDLIGDDSAGNIRKSVETTETFSARLTHTVTNTPLVPGSVSLDVISGTVDDDSAGNLYWSNDGRWAGTVNYATGAIDVSEFGLFTGVTYAYYTVQGTLDYETGALTVTFSTPQSGSVTISYQYLTTVVFAPLIAQATDFAVATGTVTFTNPAGVVATQAGDGYGLLHRRYPKWLLFQKLTEALREMKAYLLDYTDIPVSSLVDNETALADTVRIHSIWLGYTTRTPRDWVMVTRYRHVNGRLQFYDTLRADGDTVRVKYYGDVPAVDDAADTLPASIDPMWLAYETAVKCARWRLFQPGADEKAQTTLVNDLLARRNDQKARANIITPNPSALKTAILPER